nr:hypothetical protein [Tanacetum cinerariifolium]
MLLPKDEARCNAWARMPRYTYRFAQNHVCQGYISKKTITDEATSANKHMSVEKQKPAIMSGAGTSSKKTISCKAASPNEHMSAENVSFQKTIFAQAASSSSGLFLDELQVGVAGTIIVMLCRI